jgi:hypothetical protein
LGGRESLLLLEQLLLKVFGIEVGEGVWKKVERFVGGEG